MLLSVRLRRDQRLNFGMLIQHVFAPMSALFKPKALFHLSFRKLSSGLLLLNSLSLDAPLVAVSWQNLASRVLGVSLLWNEVLLLFLATWLAYAGDRLLDSFPQVERKSELPRHLFALKYRRRLAFVWGSLFLLSSILALLTIDISRLILASALVLGVVIYFAICFLFPRLARIIIPRELVVSGVFVATTLFFPLSHIQGVALLALSTYLAVILWSLAFLNCLGISCWEQKEDSRTGEITLATAFPALCSFYPLLNGLFAVWFLILMLGSEFSALPFFLFAGSLACIALLSLIHFAKISTRLKPVLADLCLLAPWIFCFLSMLRSILLTGSN